jgi:hypothetical protein
VRSISTILRTHRSVRSISTILSTHRLVRSISTISTLLVEEHKYHKHTAPIEEHRYPRYTPPMEEYAGDIHTNTGIHNDSPRTRTRTRSGPGIHNVTYDNDTYNVRKILDYVRGNFGPKLFRVNFASKFKKSLKKLAPLL